MPLPERDRDRILVYAEIRESRSANRPCRRLDLEYVTTINAESDGRLRMNLDPRAPRHLGDRIRQFLEPRLVCPAAVAQHR